MARITRVGESYSQIEVNAALGLVEMWMAGVEERERLRDERWSRLVERVHVLEGKPSLDKRQVEPAVPGSLSDGRCPVCRSDSVVYTVGGERLLEFGGVCRACGHHWDWNKQPNSTPTSLLPCPFCGGEARVETSNNETERVVCQRCRCATEWCQIPNGGDPGDARRAWNRRAK